jgi:hypothetical protein
MGWGKSWAHFNAYIPSFSFLALAAGYGVVWLKERLVALWPALFALALISLQLVFAAWTPGGLLPEESDVQAGNAYIADIASVQGEVFIPFHPWYAHLAGKRMYLQRMPVLDVSHKGKWPIQGLSDSLKNGVFERIDWDNRGVDRPFSAIRQGYRLGKPIEKELRLRVFTGAGSPIEVKEDTRRLLVPTQRWVRKKSIRP